MVLTILIWYIFFTLMTFLVFSFSSYLTAPEKVTYSLFIGMLTLWLFLTATDVIFSNNVEVTDSAELNYKTFYTLGDSIIVDDSQSYPKDKVTFAIGEKKKVVILTEKSTKKNNLIPWTYKERKKIIIYLPS